MLTQGHSTKHSAAWRSKALPPFPGVLVLQCPAASSSAPALPLSLGSGQVSPGQVPSEETKRRAPVKWRELGEAQFLVQLVSSSGKQLCC